jgi:hypothetical protein
LNGLNQNHTKTDCAESTKDVKGLGTFDEDGVYRINQQAEHARSIAENGDDDTLAPLSPDDLAFIIHPLFHAIQFKIREYPKRTIQSKEQE